MTRAQRLARLETQFRLAQIAAVLVRVRQCVPSDQGAALLAELSAVDIGMADAIMQKLTEAETAALDVECEGLLGPDALLLLDSLSAGELDALARGDTAVMRRVQRALRSGQHQGDVCP